MLLFVVLKPGIDFSENLKADIKSIINKSISARFIPDEIIKIDEVPRTYLVKS